MSGRSRSAPPDTAEGARHRATVRGDTIAAVSTAVGRGAVAVVRVTGPAAEQICRRMSSPWPTRPREATRCEMHACDDPVTLLDDGLVTWFPAPHSFTGETVVEFGTHGGSFVPAAVLAALVSAGARPALPGEFTERAVLNGKFDLLRAEAIADLIDARSGASHRAALRQLGGALSSALELLRDRVVQLDALLAYDIDFPSEDGGPLPRDRILGACDALLRQLADLLATYPAAILGREGAMIVLAGAPNAGKSSLLNALIGESRVIVSEQPGTTRDAVEVVLEHEPWPLRLVDTAGLRASDDPVEQLGIAASGRYLAQAHAVIACAETPASMRATVDAIRVRATAPIIGAFTKSDLVTKGYEIPRRELPAVAVSAHAGTGLVALLALVTESVLESLHVPGADVPVISRARHRASLERARAELREFRDAWSGGALPAPVAAVHVRAAATALDELIGAVDVDDVFARVFATFCVGK